MEANNKTPDGEVITKELPIEREVAPGLRSVFANDFVVQHNPNGEVHISFYEIVPPYLVGETPAERKSELEKIHSIKAQCVARIVTTAERATGLLGALGKNLAKLHALRDQQQKTTTEQGTTTR